MQKANWGHRAAIAVAVCTLTLWACQQGPDSKTKARAALDAVYSATPELECGLKGVYVQTRPSELSLPLPGNGKNDSAKFESCLEQLQKAKVLTEYKCTDVSFRYDENWCNRWAVKFGVAGRLRQNSSEIGFSCARRAIVGVTSTRTEGKQVDVSFTHDVRLFDTAKTIGSVCPVILPAGGASERNAKFLIDDDGNWQTSGRL